MREPRKRQRPKVANPGAQGSAGEHDTAIIDAKAEAALTVAWLKVHADLCYAIDPSGQLSAHLRDHADCREAMAEGRR